MADPCSRFGYRSAPTGGHSLIEDLIADLLHPATLDDPVQQDRHPLGLRRQRRQIRRFLHRMIVVAHQADTVDDHLHFPGNE